MIRNLNQVTFQGFGTILPERTRESGTGNLDTLYLTSDNNKLYQSDIPVGIRPGEQTAILSVSLDGQKFLDFYLPSQSARSYISFTNGRAKAFSSRRFPPYLSAKT